MPGNPKGDRRERELVNLLDASGFAVMRAPASGSSTNRELPDVLAGNGEVFYAIEAKSSSGRPIYLDHAEIDALRFFADNFGARARLAARFDREDWAFLTPDQLHQTDGGNWRIKKELAMGAGQSVEELLSEAGSKGTDIDKIITAYDADAISREETVGMLEDMCR